MKRFYLNRTTEKGQGLVEYALILVLVAVVVIAVLLTLGPQIGQVFSRVVAIISTENSGVITAAAATRDGGGNSMDITVNVSVSTNTKVTGTDSQSGQIKFVTNCSGSCVLTFASVGAAAGTVTITADAGGNAAAGYPVKGGGPP